jgi:hypothetical protein
MTLPTKLKIGFDDFFVDANTSLTCFSFYFDNGLGNIVDDHGNDLIEIIENYNRFKLKGLNSYSTFIILRTKLVNVEVTIKSYLVQSKPFPPPFTSNERRSHQ